MQLLHNAHTVQYSTESGSCPSFCFVFAEGVKKGDRVSIYLPMIPELVVTMLACARIGAVHSIVVSRMMKFFLEENKLVQLISAGMKNFKPIFERSSSSLFGLLMSPQTK